jgi:hypothetical protein
VIYKFKKGDRVEYVRSPFTAVDIATPWARGTIVRVHKTSSPYEVRWDTDPQPSENRYFGSVLRPLGVIERLGEIA